MNTLRFSKNWADKLDNKKFFTTLRLAQGFYKTGQLLQVELNKKMLGVAKIITVNNCEIEKLPDLICFIDTGYNKTETQTILKRMYPDENWSVQKIAVILLQWEKRY